MTLVSGCLETAAVAAAPKKHAIADIAKTRVAAAEKGAVSSSADSAPATTDPAPATTDPAPATTDPTPAKTEPAPVTTDPAATGDPASGAMEPAPAVTDTASADPAASHATHKPASAFLAPRPGQKVKISGYAERQPAELVDEPTANSSDKPALHRAQMRLTGSMCYACLKELQDKLKLVWGVERTKVEKTEQVSIMSASPAVSNWADAFVYYDANRVELVDIRAYIRTNGYHSYRVLDKEVSSVPPESSKKI